MTAPAIVFDLDGTLVESAPDLAATTNVLLARRGRRQIELGELRSMVGKGARVMIEKAFAATGEPATEADVKEMIPEFLEYYGDNVAVHTHPFPGILDALGVLKDRGCRLGVCTNKFESLSHKLLDALEMSHFFSAVLGGDSLSIRKPDPEHVLETIRRLGGTPDNAVMVGDSNNDIDAARAGNIASVAVTFGYTDIPARELGADRVIDSFDQLVPAIDELLGG
ncbi:MAG: phosphoglycolate phosphatase [Pseudomonadota bacterium]